MIFGLFALSMYFYLGGLIGPPARHAVQQPWKVGFTSAVFSGSVAAFFLLASARSFELEGWAKVVFVGLTSLVSPIFFFGRAKARHLVQRGALDSAPIDAA
jgi:hypothetical protein